MLRLEQYPPNAMKGLRQFSSVEVADFLGVTQNHIKKLHLEGKGPAPDVSSSGRRSYTAQQMLELRHYLDKHGRSDFKRYVPRRSQDEDLQVISVVNFKGGSGKTTTAAHLAQYLALTGHRVLAIDLDPQASLSALHGIQPELDKNPSLYEALRYDEHKKSIKEIIRPTNFPGSGHHTCEPRTAGIRVRDPAGSFKQEFARRPVVFYSHLRGPQGSRQSL